MCVVAAWRSSDDDSDDDMGGQWSEDEKSEEGSGEDDDMLDMDDEETEAERLAREQQAKLGMRSLFGGGGKLAHSKAVQGGIQRNSADAAPSAPLAEDVEATAAEAIAEEAVSSGAPEGELAGGGGGPSNADSEFSLL